MDPHAERNRALTNWNACLASAAICRSRAHLARIYRADIHVHLREAANWRRLYGYWCHVARAAS